MIIIRTINAFVTNVCALSIFAFALCTYGQGQEITKADFDKMQSIGIAGLAVKNHRQTTVSEEFVGGTIQKDKTRRETAETLQPNRSKYYSISTVNGKNETREVIRIVSNVWVRENNEQWEQNPAPAFGDRQYATNTISQTHRIVGISGSDGHSLTLYEQVSRQTKIPGGDALREQIGTLRYWVDKDGLFHQQIYEIYDVTSNTISRKHMFFQYDPKDIKIEAPQVK